MIGRSGESTGDETKREEGGKVEGLVGRVNSAEQCNGIQALSTSGSLVALGTVAGRPGHCADRLIVLERMELRSSDDSMSSSGNKCVICCQLACVGAGHDKAPA